MSGRLLAPEGFWALLRTGVSVGVDINLFRIAQRFIRQIWFSIGSEESKPPVESRSACTTRPSRLRGVGVPGKPVTST